MSTPSDRPGSPETSAPISGARERPRAQRIFRFSSVAIAGLAVLVLLLNCYAISPPRPYSSLLSISLASWLVLGIAWVVQSILAKSDWRRHRLHLAVFPLLVLAMIALATFKVPFRLTFALSRGAMNRTAHEVMTGKLNPAKIRWIGLYRVSYAGGDRYSFWFEVRGTSGTECEINGDSGFELGLRGVTGTLGPSMRKLGGGWYAHDAACSEGA